MIRVLIADDEQLFRTGVRLILESAPDLDVIAEAADGAAAVDQVLARRIDVVLMDARMPGVDGLSALEDLARTERMPAVIMLTAFDTDPYVHRALRAGAAGFLLKDTPPGELIAAVRTAAAGGAVLAPSVTRRLVAAYSRQHPDTTRTAQQRISVLSPQERAVSDAVARGLSNADVARELHLSEPTVKAHVSRALTKLDLTNRVQLALLAHEANRD